MPETPRAERIGSDDPVSGILHSLPDAIVMVNEHGEIVFANRQSSPTFGYRQDELPGRQIEALVPDVLGELQLRRQPANATEIAAQPGGNNMELMAIRKDGAAFPVEVNLSSIEMNGDTLTMISVRDLTAHLEAERKLAERSQALARSNEELEAFTTSISHDLKEPLRTVEAFSQFLLEDYAHRLDDDGRGYLEKMTKAAVRMKGLIEDLRMLSRISRHESAAAEIDLEKIVSDALDTLQAAIEQRNARIEVEGALPSVKANQSRVEQIFTNLIGNALKFNQNEQPQVSIGVRDVDGGMATIYVADNGIGISPQYHDTIFGVFQRLHRREDYEGTGAGLAIVKRAIESYGGSITVESDVGAGTTFVFTLPLWERSAEAA